MLFIILLTISSLFINMETSIKISFLSFPFIFISLFIYFYKTEIEKKSDIKYILFSHKNNNQNLKLDDIKHIYSMSKDYIQSKRTIANNDGLKLLLIIPVIFIFLLSSDVPLMAIVMYTFLTMLPIIYGAYKQTKSTYDKMNDNYISIERDVLTIYQKSIQKKIHIYDLEKIKIKYKNNTDNIEYLELFVKKNILKNSIKLQGYLDIKGLLNNLIYPEKEYFNKNKEIKKEKKLFIWSK